MMTTEASKGAGNVGEEAAPIPRPILSKAWKQSQPWPIQGLAQSPGQLDVGHMAKDDTRE